MFILTFDTDWVPQFVLDDVLDLASEHGVSATTFCTSAYELADRQHVEAAIHPNFLPGTTQGATEDDVLDFVLARHPGAMGCRTHRLYWHGGLYAALRKRCLLYDSSLGMFLHPHLEPVNALGVTRFPVWWDDGVHLHHKLSLDNFVIPRMDEPGLKVCTFHPLLVYLNSREAGDYLPAVQGCRTFRELTANQLAPYRNAGAGLRTFFLGFLKHIASRQEKTLTLRELLS